MSTQTRIFRTVVRADDPVVRDHRVHGTRILPGVTFLDLITRAARCVGLSGGLELRNVLFSEALGMAEGAERRVEVQLTAHGDKWEIAVRSGLNGEAVEEHARCELRKVGGHQEQPNDIQAFIEASAHFSDLEELYANLRKFSIEHFDFMKSRGRVHRGTAGILAQVTLGGEAARYAGHFELHPAFLDTATGVSFFSNYAAERYGNGPFIPIFIERVHVARRLGEMCHIAVPYRDERERTGADIGRDPVITLYDAEGQFAAKIEGLVFKRIRSASAMQKHSFPAVTAKGSDGKEVVLGELTSMVARALGRSPDQIDPTTGFYDLGLESADLLRLASQLEGRIGQPLYPTLLFEYPNIGELACYIAARHGSAFAVPATIATPEKVEAVKIQPEVQLFEMDWIETAAETFEKPRIEGLLLVFGDETVSFDRPVWRVLSGSTFHVLDESRVELRPDRAEDYDELLRCVSLKGLRIGGIVFGWPLLSLMHLTQAVLRRREGHYTPILYPVRQARAENHGVAAFAASLRRETRIVSVRVVEYGNQVVPEALLNELTAEESLIRFDGARRMTWKAREVGGESRSENPLRKGGVYLITGGMGGLGLGLARFLARNYQARLVLAGRATLDAAMKQAVEEIRALSSECIYVRADAADFAQMAALFKEAETRFCRIDGVFHAAGVVADSLLLSTTADEVRAVLAPKVEGSRILEELTRDSNVGFLVLFSSLSAVAGNAGQCVYGAANGYMDGLARCSGGKANRRIISIAWPLWREGGMRVSARQEERLREEAGMVPLETEAGFAVLEQILKTGGSNFAVVHGDRVKIHALLQPAPAKRTGPPLEQYREHDIAIIGASGRYPQARDLEEFWHNLAEGRDCISEIPKERWDHNAYFDPDKTVSGKCYSRWGGFLENADHFDPLFFNISPREAESMDPQERLFLEAAWSVLEDAGYCRTSLARPDIERKVGVFVGVMWGGYQLHGAAELAKRNVVTANSPYWSIANRVSYYFDLRGPSMAVDAACSSSLLAIHLACESLRRGECRMAIAGGVNLSLHAGKYLLLSQMGMLSSHGRCKTFAADGDGYVPGEGVGAVVLKPARQAVADGDTIHAVIRGSAVNHDGRGNGFTVPNPAAQAEVISAALHDADVHPRTISCIEAHGTGTSLGDPVEIAGLTRAFSAQTGDTQFCAISSVKSVIGHLEAAAGISAISKVLLQMRKHKLVPSLHAGELNPAIDFAKSPFVVQTKLEDWRRPSVMLNGRTSEYPRRAGISSFGAGGANVHVVLEEPTESDRGAVRRRVVPVLILSAPDSGGLKAVARRLADRLRGAEVDFLDALFTLQVGREALPERVAFVVNDLEQAVDALEKFVTDLPDERRITGRASKGVAGRAQEVRQSDPRTLAESFVAGEPVDWHSLSEGGRRISLPTFPFNGKRYWFSSASAPALPTAGVTKPTRVSFFKPVWKEGESSAAGQDVGPLLLVGGTEGVAEQLRRIQPGMVHVRSSEGIESVRFEAQGQAVVICSDHSLISAGEPALRCLFAVCRQFSKLRIKNGRILFISSDLATCHAAEGFLRSMQLEHPGLNGIVLRIDGTTEGRALPIDRELANEGGFVQNQSGRRLVRDWVGADVEFGTKKLRTGGVYVITGGAGGIGLLMARHLAERYQAKLILLGRRKELEPAKTLLLESLERDGAEILYAAADLSDRVALNAALDSARRRFGTINGVLHCAGIVDDSFLARKTEASAAAVFAPKISGTLLLDELTEGDDLDFFVMFSSVSAVLGNLGQCDYAAANGFMDGFAAQRENLRSRGLRKGKSISINWPYWAEGGMQAGELVLETLKKKGLEPISTTDAVRAFEGCLSFVGPQLLIWCGDADAFRGTITSRTARREAIPVVRTDIQGISRYLTQVLAETVKVEIGRIDPDTEFADYGVDSIALREVIQRINRDLGDVLDPFVVMEKNTIRALAAHLAGVGAVLRTETPANGKLEDRPAIHAPDNADVAVVGMACRFPGAENIEEFWDNLATAKCSIGEVPKDRWDPGKHFVPESRFEDGKSYSKWGGFIEGVDLFDPEFFEMDETTARVMDPLHRLLLEVSARAFQDGGYDRNDLPGQRGGIFVGARQGEYAERVGLNALLKADPVNAWKHNSACMIAHPVAEFFDLRGPSAVIDTACSSSLVTVHLACESLRRGECDFAVAGGVELLLEPNVFIHFSQSKSLSGDGRCRPFESAAGGTVLGEGCGIVILKPLAKAIADGDCIHAVIRGSAMNNFGGGTGAEAQVETMKHSMQRALAAARLSISKLGYLELHGEGSLLRDAVELRAVKELWEEQGRPAFECAIGSVKANIGHLLLASGIAGFIKACLLVSQGAIVPHSREGEVARYAGLSGSPFTLPRQLSEWRQEEGLTRTAGVNATGIAGVNCFVVCAEAPKHHARRSPAPRPMKKRRCWLETGEEKVAEPEALGRRDSIREVLIPTGTEMENRRGANARISNREERIRELLNEVREGRRTLESARTELGLLRTCAASGAPEQKTRP